MYRVRGQSSTIQYCKTTGISCGRFEDWSIKIEMSASIILCVQEQLRNQIAIAVLKINLILIVGTFIIVCMDQ